MNKIIFIERPTPNYRYWQNLIRKKKNQLPLEEIIEKYKGFEGELVSFVSLKSKELDVCECSNSIVRYDYAIFVEEYNPQHCLFNSLTSDCFRFMGYDLGVCELGGTLYSSIFNEILFGCVDELVNYNYSLNINLLFSEISYVEEYVRSHDKLLLQGKDVEKDKMKIYKIWELSC